MPAPEYLICLNCETPCYVFEYKDGELREAVCEACGNDDTEQFVTADEFDALSAPEEN
jgi:hypothetical protein